MRLLVEVDHRDRCITDGSDVWESSGRLTSRRRAATARVGHLEIKSPSAQPRASACSPVTPVVLRLPCPGTATSRRLLPQHPSSVSQRTATSTSYIHTTASVHARHLFARLSTDLLHMSSRLVPLVVARLLVVAVAQVALAAGERGRERRGKVAGWMSVTRRTQSNLRLSSAAAAATAAPPAAPAAAPAAPPARGLTRFSESSTLRSLCTPWP